MARFENDPIAPSMANGRDTLQLVLTLTAPWSDMTAITLGGGDVQEYLLVEEGGVPRARFDLCRAGAENWLKTDAIRWRDRIVVGFGERVSILDMSSPASHCIKLHEYFQGLYSGDEWLLVASGADIVRLDSTGRIVWRSERLGIDGVIVHNVRDGVVSGAGEWNPPNGWVPFRISLRDGSSVS